MEWIVWTRKDNVWKRAMFFESLEQACKYADYLVEGHVYDGKDVYIAIKGNEP